MAKKRETPKRQAISKKLRFEVFKKNSFKCIYCGRSAPDVLLEVDHIIPVSKGGKNDLFNLVTSCFDCNRGKGKKKLSNNDEFNKQREELEVKNERLNQLNDLIRWRDEISNFEEKEINFFDDEFSRIFDRRLSVVGRNYAKKIIKKHTLAKCIDILNELLNVDISKIDIFKHIDKCLTIKNSQIEKPYLKDLFYIRKIILNKFDVEGYDKFELTNALEKNILMGVPIDILKKEAITSDSLWQYMQWLNEGY